MDPNPDSLEKLNPDPYLYSYPDPMNPDPQHSKFVEIKSLNPGSLINEYGSETMS